MSSKFDVEFKNLIKVYEANDNIEPGSASSFVGVLGDLGKAAFGAVNYYLNFKKFYNYALKQAYEISAEAQEVNKLQLASTIDKAFLKRKAKLQYTINELKDDVRKWKEYLTPLSSKTAKKSKAALDVIESVVQNAEYGNLKRKNYYKPTPVQTTAAAAAP